MINAETELTARYQVIYREKMLGMPICNPALKVQAVGFRELGKHRLGVLVTPWFMNLMLLPGDETWSNTASGSREDFSLPAERCEFVVNHDEELGTCLSAILFRTVLDFPDQDTAVAVAEEVLDQLYAQDPKSPQDASSARNFSRRSLLTGMGAS